MLAGVTTRAFAHLNLRWNPFGEATREERRSFAIERIAVPAAGSKSQILGHAGHGKSSTLLALQARMPTARYLYVPRPDLEPPPVIEEHDAPLLLDEAQRLPRAALRAVLRSARTVVLGTHDDLCALSPGMQTHVLDRCTPALLGAIVDARLSWAARASGPVPRPTPRLLEALLGEHGANLRAIEAALYLRYQGLSEVADVDV